MSLENKFDEIHQSFIEDKFIATDLIKEQCVQICDEFAVGFAQFCWEYDRKNINHTKGFCELLEIYKQGL